MKRYHANCVNCSKALEGWYYLYESGGTHHEVSPDDEYDLPHCDNLACPRYGLATYIVQVPPPIIKESRAND
jgi:hypothetical protein